MNDLELRTILAQVANQSVTPEIALEKLKSGPFKKTELGFANLDHHRSLRHKIGEVVYGESKSEEQLVAILEHFLSSSLPVLVTRLNDSKRAVLKSHFPDGVENKEGRTFTLKRPSPKKSHSGEPYVAVLAAGTSDVFVAEEAAEVCVAMGVAHEKIYDVGVTGLHRLLEKIEVIQKASAVVVIAGMEGALPSVVAGLVGRPVFAVPTSVGYGASFQGLAALLAMLNCCAPGVTVVNIDNGFSAAFAACTIVHTLLDQERRLLEK